jgi:hypothetical protein
MNSIIVRNSRTTFGDLSIGDLFITYNKNINVITNNRETITTNDNDLFVKMRNINIAQADSINAVCLNNGYASQVFNDNIGVTPVQICGTDSDGTILFKVKED